VIELTASELQQSTSLKRADNVTPATLILSSVVDMLTVSLDLIQFRRKTWAEFLADFFPRFYFFKIVVEV
jgi:hypothetical protein